MGQEKDLDYYYKLIDCNNYCKLMNFLKKENGKVQENYHKPIKNKQGFHRHHKYEIIHDNLGNKKNKNHLNNYEKYQKKSNLVYCNLIEHFIIHSLIILLRSKHRDSDQYKFNDDNDPRNGFKSFKFIFRGEGNKKDRNKPCGLNAIMGQINHNYIEDNQKDGQEVSAEEAEKIINYVGEKLIKNENYI